MMQVLRAFAWIRWRMFVNSLEQTGSRDMLERFSLAAEKLGPLMAAVLLIPSALFLAALGIAAGYALGSGDPRPLAFSAARYLLIVVPLLAVFGPLFLPAADRTNPVRLLLLPIPRSTLYVAQASAAFGDVWNILMIPLVAGVPLGLAAAGALQAALATLAGAVLLVLVIVGLAGLATSVLHLVVRDRRRGELLALAFIIIVPMISLLPSMMDDSLSRRARDQARRPVLPVWAAEAGSRAASAYPTELFVSTARAAASEAYGPAAAALGALALTALLLHGAGLAAFRRVLDSPGSSGARRSTSTRAIWGRRLPGLSSGASAVAFAHLRLALRTPRGRSVLLSPLVVLVVFGVLMSRGSGLTEIGPLRLPDGLSLAALGSFVCLISILPLAMNQFAVDRAGLTMSLLSPLSDAELLAGKAAGNALIAAAPVLISFSVALTLLPAGSPYLWLALLLALPAIYLPVAPIAAILSSIFPRAVDMNSIGRGSNAHGAAGLLGMLAFLLAAAPPLLLTLLAVGLFDRPSLAPLLVLLWCAVACAVGRLLFMAARRIFAARRENLAMIV